MRVVVATQNPGKLRELERLFADVPGLELVSLASVGIDVEVVEDRDSFHGNALKKAQEIAGVTSCAALADDSGLVVDALDGRPGVWSARYAGENATAASNNEKLLRELAGVARENRTARFVCAIVLVDDGGRELAAVEGVCEGCIAETRRGSNGFGYDPVFVPEGYDRTMAELVPANKDAISHRAKATQALRVALVELVKP